MTTYEEKRPEPLVYPLRLPEGYADWPRYHDARFGYSLPHPADWRVETLAEPGPLAAVALRDPRWPAYPVVVRVHAGETHYDQYEPAAAPPLLRGSKGYGVYSQGWIFGEEAKAKLGSQRLAGYSVDHEAEPQARAVSVLFSAHGRTYELALHYPVGFDAPQPLLTAYSAIVEGFRLDAPQGPTPTPPVKQALGRGPFLSQEQAMARVRERDGRDVELLTARLVSEAEARRVEGPCVTFTGHPDGVWLLTVRGPYEGRMRALRLYLDAATGEQLCGEEFDPQATPWPTLPPGTTATPVPRNPAPGPTATRVGR